MLKTTPATVIDDYKRLMRLADYQHFLPRDNETALKINISWHYFYPACSTTPWQLDGVIATLLEDGYCKEKLYGCHNRTVVVSASRGEIANKQKQVLEKVRPAQYPLVREGRGVDSLHAQGEDAGAGQGLSRRHPHSQTAGRIERHPSAHHEDACVHAR